MDGPLFKTFLQSFIVGSCGLPFYFDDGYCDDENNNEGCDYDGGDCCPPHNWGWNSYCTICECIDPDATPMTTDTTGTTTWTGKLLQARKKKSKAVPLS